MSISLAIICLLVLMLVLSSYFAIKFALILMNIEDALENSLEILDERQTQIAEILEIPLFFDSIEVRKVHSDIEDCRNSILQIASVLTANVSSNRVEDTELEKEKDS